MMRRWFVAIPLCVLSVWPQAAQTQGDDLAGMRRLDRLVVSLDLGRAVEPSSLVFESTERLHVVYPEDASGKRQRAIVNLLTRQVSWFPVPPMVAPPPALPIPGTRWSAEHALLVDGPSGEREIFRTPCRTAKVFLRREGLAAIYGCGDLTVVDLKGRELLTDHFSRQAPVPYAFARDGQRLRVMLHDPLPDGGAAESVNAVVDYEFAPRRRSAAAAVHCRKANLCLLSQDASLVATVSESGAIQVYSDSADRLTHPPEATANRATVRFRVVNGIDPVAKAVVRFQSVLRRDGVEEFKTDAGGRIYADTIPNSLYCAAVIVDGAASGGPLIDFHYPEGVDATAAWHPPSAKPSHQESVCAGILEGKPPAFAGKATLKGSIVGYVPQPARPRKVFFENILSPDLHFVFDLSADGGFAGEVPEGIYRMWAGIPGAPPSFSAVAALAGPSLVVKLSEHDPETEAKVWGERRDFAGGRICLRSAEIEKCVDTSRLGQYGFRIAAGEYDATATRGGATLWTGKLRFVEPGEYRDPIPQR